MISIKYKELPKWADVVQAIGAGIQNQRLEASIELTCGG